jgi:hypothetical protein
VNVHNMTRIVYILLLSIFFAVGGYAQIMQTTGGAGGNKFKALKADSFLVVPKGTDTANLANPKWGESTTGALFVKTADSTLWFKVGGKWVQAGGNFTSTVIGTDTTIYDFVVDSTGQAANRVLFAGNRKIRSDNVFLWDSVNNKLVINHPQVSIGGPNVKLWVQGRATINGTANVSDLQITNLTTVVNDTTNYKPLVASSTGVVYKHDRWPSGGGSGTVTSISQGYGIINSTNPITTTGTQRIDTFAISTRAWRDKLADSLGAIIATKGSGTVTSFSSGNLSPLFTTSVATASSTPSQTFSLSNAGAYTVFGNQTNASAAPSFAKLNINSIDATGTPSATTYLRGDGSWSTVSGGSGVTTVGTFSGSSQTNGASISGSTITFGPADATNPGMVSTGAQTFAGAKTFSSAPTFSSLTATHVPYLSTDGLLASTSNFTWDNTNQILFSNTAFRTGNSTAARKLALYDDGNFRIGFGLQSNGSTPGLQAYAPSNWVFDWYPSGNGNIQTSGTPIFRIGNTGSVSYTQHTIRSTSSTDGIILKPTTSNSGGTIEMYTLGAANFSTVSFYNSSNTLAASFGYGDASAVVTPDAFVLGPRTANGDLRIISQSAANLRAYMDEEGRWVFNSPNIEASAQLAVVSTTRGTVPAPLMTSTQRNAIGSPATALQVYNSSDKTVDVYDGTRWNNTPNGLKGSATLDFGNTAAQSSADLTITVTGAADGDIVIVGPVNASTNANSCFTAWVSAANTVTVRFNNYSSAAIDPASGTFKVYVIKN